MKDGDLALRYKTREKAKHAVHIVHIVHISNALLGAEYALQIKWIDRLAAFAFQSGGHFVLHSKVGGHLVKLIPSGGSEKAPPDAGAALESDHSDQ